MRKDLGFAVVFVVLIAAGCNKEGTPPRAPGTPSPNPSTNTPGQPAASFELPRAPEGAIALTPENTKIEFVGSKEKPMPGKHNGGFNKFSGWFNAPKGDLSASALAVEIDTDSITTDTERLTGHLKTPDFFDVKKHPKAGFVSTDIRKGDKAGDYEIVGDLTLHGVKKKITFPARIKLSGKSLELTAVFTLNRFDYNIAYGKGAVNDNVDVKVSVHTKGK